MKEVMCGIDLGTTNSCIAYLLDGKPVAVEIENGTAIVPSVVSIDETTGAVIVGARAKNRLGVFTEHSIRSVKRLMGKEVHIKLGDKTYSPAEVSAFILKYLVERASEQIGREIRQAVITVPAYFNDAQRRATIEAGELAGLEVLRIVNEPTAASLIYEQISQEDVEDNPYVLVYDLGGGTFDVSILELRGEVKEVLASGGDTALGGDDFDERLVELFLRNMREKSGYDFSDPDKALHIRLREIAEKAKMALSDSPYVQIKEVAVTSANGEPVNLDLEVGRSDYEDLIRDLVDKTLEKVRETLREASLSAEEIENVILVGGATKTPLIQESLSDMFDREMYHSVDPDLCVALGASVQSGLIAGEPLGHILLDVTAHSLGVKTLDGIDYETGAADYFSVIIRRNTKIPARKAEVYYTMGQNQPGVDVEVFQGESPSCKENTLIGEFDFLLKPSPEGSPVTTELAYDKEGIIHVTIEQKGYNNRKEVTLDVRKKTVATREAKEEERKIFNYILEKAKKLAEDAGIDADLRAELLEVGGAYEEALRKGDEDAIEEVEGRLLEIIEEAEEGPEEAA